MLDAERRLATAGFVATAVAYGPARMGFGLFLPEFREAFTLSSTQAGLIAAAAFGGQLAALGLARPLTARIGPGVAVTLGMLLAAIGLAGVASATTAPVLAAGIVVAAMSAGLAWSPYNDAADRIARPDRRADVLSLISTGTTVGIGTAALLALALVLADLGWRPAWTLFAVAATGALALNLATFRVFGRPPSRPARGAGAGARPRLGLPIAVCAFVFGFTSAVFIAFASDRIAAAGGLAGVPAGTAPPLVFAVFAVAGGVGMATGRLERWIGLGGLIRAIFTAAALSLVLLAVAPASWPAMVASAGLQGACVMMASAKLAFWSARLSPDFPTAGFTTVLLVYAGGSILGPAVAGVGLDVSGPEVTFAAVAGLAAVTALVVRPDAASRTAPSAPA